MAKYIKKLVIDNDHSFEPTILEFRSGVNVIIGPKGGGKSTLMKLINDFHTNNAHTSSLQKILKNNLNLNVKSVEYSDGEIVTRSQLSSKSTELVYENFITQEDDLKTRLDQVDSALIEKNEFINEIYNENKKILEEDFIKYINSVKKIHSLYSNTTVEYSRINKLINKENSTTVLSSRFYIDIESINSIDDIIKNNKKQKALIQELINNIRYKNDLLSISNFIESDIFDNTDIENLLNKIEELNMENIKLERFNLLSRSLNKASNNMSNIRANNESEIEKSTRFKENIRSFSNSLYKEIKNNKDLFEKLSLNSNVIHFKKSTIGKLGLVYEIDEEINIMTKISENYEIDGFTEILSSLLYKPSKNVNLFSSWIETAIKKNGLKKDSIDLLLLTLEKSIKLIISNFVNVKYEDKNYSELSLGQRTSLMLENKLKRLDEQSILFLDQPEDNIDNHTIANVLVRIISEKQQHNKINQIFVVTHNANFGILLNPSSLTISQISKQSGYENINSWYRQFFNINDIDKNIDIFKEKQSYYLEGGNNILIKRYNKLIGDNND